MKDQSRTVPVPFENTTIVVTAPKDWVVFRRYRGATRLPEVVSRKAELLLKESR